MFIDVDGTGIWVTEQGDGEEAVVFSHSFLVDQRHFASQMEALADSYRVIAYDHRGHGKSDKPHESYDLERIVDDGAAVVEAMDAAPCHWVGLSTGGFVGMRLAVWRPELLRSLVLMDTSAQPEAKVKQLQYEAMFGVVKLLGWKPVIGTVMKIMFGESFLDDPSRAAEVDMWRERFTSLDDIPALHAFARAIFGRADFSHRLDAIDLPTLVAVGAEDIATTPDRARALAARISSAELAMIPRAGHLSTVANPDVATQLLVDFLAGVGT